MGTYHPIQSNNPRKAFIWDEFTGARDLGNVLVNDYGLDLTGWILHTAVDISADGTTIVGYGYKPNGDAEAFVAVILEPATLGLFLIGGLALLRRRKLI